MSETNGRVLRGATAPAHSRHEERVSGLEDAGFDVTVPDAAEIQCPLMALNPDLGSPIEVGESITITHGS